MASQQLTKDHLIDPTSVVLNRQGLAKDGTIDIYLHRPAGPVAVQGGDFGAQTIQAMAINQSMADYIASVVADLNKRLNIDFRFTDSAAKADISFYFDTEIVDGDPTGVTLGIALPNDANSSVNWELVLNTPELVDDQKLMNYACIHELGHALGMEHPFDSSDGDVYLSTDPLKSALPSQTVLAYPAPGETNLPQTYTDLDWEALQSIWGIRPSNGSSSSQTPTPAPSASPRIVEGTSADDILTGTSGRDILRGKEGNDQITGGGGADQLWGGIGANWFSSASDGVEDLLFVEFEAKRAVGRSRVQAPETVDQIAAVGAEDSIIIVSKGSGRLGFRPVRVNNSVYGYLQGTGIFVGSQLQAVVTTPDLSLAQVRDITELMTPAAAAALV